MTLNDPLANVLSHIMIQDKKGKKQTRVQHVSKIITDVLTLFKDNKYLGDFTVIEDSSGRGLQINLIGAINKTGVIKPRYSVKVTDYKRYEKRYLPAYGFGFLVVSTNKGIMTQEEAVKKNLGGRLLAYIF